MDLSSIGANIRAIRTQKNITQEELAFRCDVTPNYIGALERGERSPALDTLILIINALGVPSSEVLHDLVDKDYSIETSLFAEKMKKISDEDRAMILAVVSTMLKRYRKIR